MTVPEHAASRQSYSFYADLRRGVGYAFARRLKIIAALTSLAGMFVSQHYVDGWPSWLTAAVVFVAGGGLVNFARYIPPPAKGPAPTERATERGLGDPTPDQA